MKEVQGLVCEFFVFLSVILSEFWRYDTIR